MTIIYIVTASSGQWDDYIKWNVKAFYTQEAAQEYVDSNTKGQILYAANEEVRDLMQDFYEQQEDFPEKPSEKYWQYYYDRVNAEEVRVKALVQEKYPDADLDTDEDFNGYNIAELELVG